MNLYQNLDTMAGYLLVCRIEWAASAMEMSVLSARNVANLVANQWGGKEEVGGRQARQEL